MSRTAERWNSVKAPRKNASASARRLLPVESSGRSSNVLIRFGLSSTPRRTLPNVANKFSHSTLTGVLLSDRTRRQAGKNRAFLRSLSNGQFLKSPNRFDLNVLRHRLRRSELCLRQVEKHQENSLILSNRA
jgi:hypothetical protein